MRVRNIVILSLLGFAALWGCKQKPGESGSANSSEIPIGEYGSMSGTEATFGLSTHEGITLALDQINEAGGILGKKIHLYSEDDSGSQDQAVAVVQKLINRDHVVAVLGEVASSNSRAGGGVCQNARIPMISPSSTNPSVTKDKDYVFRVCFTDDFQGGANARFALDKGWKKIAVMTATDSDYSKGLSQFFKAEFTKGGGTVVADEEYREKTDLDFKPQLTRIKATNPEAVYLPGYYTQVVLILRQARELGLTVPFFGGDGWDSPATLSLGTAVDGCFFSDHYSPDEQRPEVQTFVKAYEAKYGKTPDAMAVTGYDAARVLCNAIERAGKADPQAIRDALATTRDFPGASGKITIDANRNASKPIVILKIEHGKTTIADTIQPQKTE